MILAGQKSHVAEALSGDSLSVRVSEDLKVRDSSIGSTVTTSSVVGGAELKGQSTENDEVHSASSAAAVDDALERQASDESAAYSTPQIQAEAAGIEEPQQAGLAAAQQQAEAEKQRYYMVVGGNNTCIEEDEWKWSFLCAAAEAKALNRVLVTQLMYCFPGRDGNLVERPMALYYDMDKMKSIQPLISDLEFDLRLGDWRSAAFRKRYTVREFGPHEPTSDVRAEAGDAHLVVRVLQESQRAARICKGEDTLVRNEKLVQERKELKALSAAIAASMGGDYDAVFVKRPKKKSLWTGWSNVDRLTRPAALVKSLPRFIPKGRHVYIASNERTPGFFSPLASLYKIHVLSDYRHLWAPGSDWYNDYRDVLAALRMRGADPQFDMHMKRIVDRLVMRSASMKVDTFKDIIWPCLSKIVANMPANAAQAGGGAAGGRAGGAAGGSASGATGGGASGASSPAASPGSTHSPIRDAASGQIKGMESFAERKASRGRFIVISLIAATAAAAWITNYTANSRGQPVPTVPKEKDKDQTHHPEGPVIKNAPKHIVAGPGVTGHNEALKGAFLSRSISPGTGTEYQIRGRNGERRRLLDGGYKGGCYGERLMGQAGTGEVATGKAVIGEVVTGEEGTGEAVTGEAGTGEAGTGEAGTGEGRTGEAGTGEAGTGEAGTGEAGTGEAGTGEAGTGEAGTGEAGTGEAGTGEAGTGEAGTGEAGTGEAGTGEAGTGEAGTGEAGTGEAGTGEAGTGEAGTGEAGTGEAGTGRRVQGRRVQGRRVQGRRVQGRRVQGRRVPSLGSSVRSLNVRMALWAFLPSS
ncbi:unnamed protein product [Closterium sp. Yama58-4]|nr:unnamed protein product [Closterium sp. Yama58-4]